MKKTNISNLIFSALFTAVIAVISQICILTPLGIPITLQTFAISLCGYLLGAKWAVASVLTYIGVGALGLPVFSGFHGGIHHFLCPSGGFVIGFIFLSLFCGIFKKTKNHILQILSGIFGLLICHLIGVIQFAILTETGFWPAFIASSLPFLIKDILSVAIAYFAALNLNKYILVKTKTSD